MSVQVQYTNQISKSSTFVEILQHRANEQCEQNVFTFLHRGELEADTLTYGELDLKAKAIAAYLQSFDATGERALLLYPSGLDFIAAFLGCLYAGVVAVPAYPPKPNQKITRLQEIIKDARAKVVLTKASLLPKVKSRLGENSGYKALHWLATDDVLSSLAESWRQPKIDKDTLAFLQYTSGSTGTPKGVMISHHNLIHNSNSIYSCFGHTTESKGIIWLPPYHDMGLIGGILQPLYGGFPVILISPIDFLQKPFRWLQAISHYKATTSGGPNFAYELCVNKTTAKQRESLDLSSWEVAFNGAEPVRVEILDKFATVFEPYGFRKEAFYPCYGMAETTLFVTGGLKTEFPVIKTVVRQALEQNQIIIPTNQEEYSWPIVSCGQTWGEQKVVIVDPATLTSCSAQQVGEIWVSGMSIAQGYWNNSEETLKTFHAYLADTGEGPFLRTGDLGFVQDGELFITGRLKDIIIIKGQNHYPQDIELTIENSHPALKPNCGAAFSIEIDNAEKLVIVQEVERSYLRKLNAEEVISNIREAVTAEHSLETFAIVLVKTGSIPKTSSGKIQRHMCKLRFLNGSLKVLNDWSENPRGKAEFLHLEADVESVLKKLQATGAE